MIKSVLNTSYDFGEQNAHLIGVTTRGLDTDHLRKIASSSKSIFEDVDVRPEKGKAIVHVVAMGAAPHYPSNKNGDLFYDTDRAVEIPMGEDIQLTKGLDKTHITFETNAKVFKEHRNTKTDKVYGDVVKSRYNDDMRRVELLLSIPVDEWQDELKNLESGDGLGVSMSCFPAGAQVRVRGGEFKKIEDVTLGDEVYTAEGNFKPVTSTMSRESDQVVDITLKGWSSDPIRATKNHEVLAARFEDIPRFMNKLSSDSAPWYFKRDHRDDLCDYLTWVQAGDLTCQHVLAMPIYKKKKENSVTLEEARLWGYYLSEGSVGFNYNKGGEVPSRISFAHHVDDILPLEVPYLEKWTSSSITNRERGDVGPGRVTNCFGTEAATRVLNAVGRANQKHVPVEMYDAPDESKLAFITAWLNGDGWQDSAGIHWSMASSGRTRSLDLQMLIATLGVPSSVSAINHPPRDISGNGVVSPIEREYVVSVSNYYSQYFSDAGMTKAKVIHKKQQRGPGPWISGNYLMAPVKKIENIEGSEFVYNLSVEEDETYTVSNLAVHNCSLAADQCSMCGKKARTRKDYCNCLKFDLNQITADGHQIAAINDDVKFFDISGVANPADRIAFGLLKAASAGVIGGAELAEMLHIPIPMLPERTKFAATLKKLAEIEKTFEAQDATLLAANPSCAAADTKDLPEDTVKKLATSGLNAEQTLGALADVKVTLSIKDFLKIILGEKFQEIEPNIRSAEDRLPGVFSRMCVDPKVQDGVISLPSTPFPFSLGHLLKDITGSNGFGAGPKRRRVTITVLKGTSPFTVKSASVAPSNDVGETLAQLYGQYKVALCHKFCDDNDLTFTSALSHYIQS